MVWKDGQGIRRKIIGKFLIRFGKERCMNRPFQGGKKHEDIFFPCEHAKRIYPN